MLTVILHISSRAKEQNLAMGQLASPEGQRLELDFGLALVNRLSYNVLC